MNGAIIPSELGATVFAPIDSVLNTNARRAIIRPDNPPPGIAGFIFDIPESERLRFRSRSTDHFLEDNTSIVDQIGLLPEQFTVRGIVGELAATEKTEEAIAKIANALPTDPELEPEFTPGAEQSLLDAQATEAATEAALASSNSLFQYFDANAPQPPNQTKQTKVLLYFRALWAGRQLFSVETPWGFMTDMSIEYMDAEQPGDSRFASNFEITFKKIRIAGSATVTAGKLAGRLNQQMAPVTQNGNAGTTPATAQQESLLRQLLGPNTNP